MNPVLRVTFPSLSLCEEIPPVSGDVKEDRNSPVGFGTRFTDKGDTGLGHSPVRGVEVIDPDEEPDPAGCLTTNGGTLVFAVGAGKALSARPEGGQPPIVSVARRW